MSSEGRAAASPTLHKSEILLYGGGAIMLVGLFLPFFSAGDFKVSAWEEPFFPLSVLPFLLGLIAVASSLAGRQGWGGEAGGVAGFTWGQIRPVLALDAVVLFLAFLLVKAGVPLGVGYWLGLAGSLAIASGAVLEWRAWRGSEAEASSGTRPFWFSVAKDEPLVDVNDSSRTVATLHPGKWYLAIGVTGSSVIVRNELGREGTLPAHLALREQG